MSRRGRAAAIAGRRPAMPGFGLSFLDVLCCGLGSAVLLLLIVKHGPTDAVAQDRAYLATQTGGVQERVADAERRRDGLRQQVLASQQALADRSASLDAASGRQRTGAARQAALLAQLQAERSILQASAAELRTLQAQGPPQPGPAPRSHEQQLTGLNIESDLVAIFLDSSASMLHRSLVEIIRLRASNERLQRHAQKWAKAKDAAQWAFDQVPEGGRLQFFAYSSALRGLDGKPLAAGDAISWRTKAEEGTNAQALQRLLAPMRPAGATDLKQIFAAAAKLAPRPKQMLIVTDGFPTLPGGTRLGRLRGCKTPKRGTTAILSPNCRLSVFLDAVAVANKHLDGVRMDVILLPLEGDANAARGYWLLSALSGGRLLSPARGWPYG